MTNLWIIKTQYLNIRKSSNIYITQILILATYKLYNLHLLNEFDSSNYIQNFPNTDISIHKLLHIFKIFIHVTSITEGWLESPDLWFGQKPWWNWYLTPLVNFGEVRRVQLAKSTLLTSSLVPLGSFQIF